jgi:hypothetical protein
MKLNQVNEKEFMPKLMQEVASRNIKNSETDRNNMFYKTFASRTLNMGMIS